MEDDDPDMEHTLVVGSRHGHSTPFITIAIPHYKNRRYLEVVLASVFSQNADSYEIVVSDDCSPDDSRQVVPKILRDSGRPFRYYAQPENLGYDGNVRFCLSAAEGKYVFLLGNDDALAEPDSLERITTSLRELGPGVAFVNFADYATGMVTRRAQGTQLLGSGPDTAIRFFRSFSFVSGLIFDRTLALQHETSAWDGSIYYQIYLASRIIASGGDLGAIEVCAVRKDVRLDGKTVPNYVTLRSGAPLSLESRHTGLDSVIRVTADAVLPKVPEKQRSGALRRIIGQVLTTSYPHWLFEYRRVANWTFAAGVARGTWPRHLLAEYSLSEKDRAWLWAVYTMVTAVGLLLPASLFARFRVQLADLVRRHQQASSGLD
jgi:hypothetical protein